MIIKKHLNNIKKNIRYFTEYPLVKVDNIFSTKNYKQKINTIVHQTWENRLFGKTHTKEIHNFRKLNPNLDFKIYDVDERDEYMFKNWGKHPIYHIFNNALYGPMKSDIFRYCILYTDGGYYFDISKGCKVMITDLHSRDSEALITFDVNELYLPSELSVYPRLLFPNKYLVQWGFGFSVNHKLLMNMIDNIVSFYPYYKDKIFNNPKYAILSLTGPGMFTKVVREYFINNNCSRISQAGIFFDGHGIFKMKGSGVRHDKFPSYTDVRNTKICV